MTDILPPFESFSSIPRMKRGCTITEKIDGTNAQIYISDDLSVVQAGSRNRWITPQDDNYGFAGWVELHKEELKALGPGRHFGEWWGYGIQRRYGLQEKRFSLFNSARWGLPEAVEPEAVEPTVRSIYKSPPPPCCSVVPVLYEGPFSSTVVEEVLAALAELGSQAAPGFMQPEGVVVYLQSSRQLYKVTLDGDGHKGQKSQERAA